jgi:hypothetical protein
MGLNAAIVPSVAAPVDLGIRVQNLFIKTGLGDPNAIPTANNRSGIHDEKNSLSAA